MPAIANVLPPSGNYYYNSKDRKYKHIFEIKRIRK